MNKTKQVAVHEVLRRLEQTVNDYVETLERVSLAQLLWKPAVDEWSLGQMLMHLIQSAQGMQLAHVRHCLAVAGMYVTEADYAKIAAEHATRIANVPKTLQGEALFQYGSFPAERIQVPPSPQYTPLQPDNKQQLINGLQETVRQMVEVAPVVTDVRAQWLARSAVNGWEIDSMDGEAIDTLEQRKSAYVEQHSESCAERAELSLPTATHPRLGGLNAWEWFWLVEMHYRHHLHQQQRLEDSWRQAHA
ncbi:DinB family protein [Paenibacillus sp. SGZ-1009]|uniref:DinB family protein n=1 Tax=Paenibacillus campi TaxID=3106031 RepID=UPI002AFE3CED|nr:DinB family protein [Paenibacillus sp. SGZ-1009]